MAKSLEVYRIKESKVMKTYSITSSKFEGEIVAVYDDRHELINLDISGAAMDIIQKNWLMSNSPTTEDRLQEMKSRSPYMVITSIPEREITFEAFWQHYDDKINSSKKRAKAKWEKMTKTQQTKAYHYIDRYFASLPYGTRKKYVETYLNAELWNN